MSSFINRPFRNLQGPAITIPSGVVNAISLAQGGESPLLSALAVGEAPSDGLTAAMTQNSNYTSTAGLIVSAVAEASINAGAFSAGDMSTTLSPSDVVAVQVRVTDDQANERVYSAGTQVVAGALTAPVIAAAPTIAGSAVVGQTLVATLGSVTGNPTPTRGLQWEADGSPISGATSLSYTIASGDIGAVLTIVHAETNSEGSDVEESAPTSAVADVSTVPDAQSAPALALLTNETHRGITATLAADPADNGDPITSRDIELSPDGATNITRFSDVGAEGAVLTERLAAYLTGFAVGGNVFARSRAVNAIDPDPANWSAWASVDMTDLPALPIDNTLEPFRGQIRDTDADGLINTDAVAVVTNLEIPGVLERYTDNSIRITTRSDGPRTSLSASSRSRVEFRGEAERSADGGWEFDFVSALESFTDANGADVDFGRTVFGQGYDFTNAEDAWQMEWQRRDDGTADGRIRWAPTVGASSVSQTLINVPMGTIVQFKVRQLPNGIQVWLNGADPLTAAPDFDTDDFAPFLRDGALDVYLKFGNYVQVDFATTPVQTAVVWHYTNMSDAATVFDVPAQMAAPTVTALSSSSISVDLAAAPSNGGLPITGYDLRYSTDQATWTEVLNVADPEAIIGLAAGTQYFVQTRARNALGPADTWSPSGTETTDAVPGNVISLSGFNEATDDGTLFTDAPSQGNWIWATSAQTETLTANGSGAFTGGTILESSSIAVGASGATVDFPTTTTTGDGPRRLHVYQRIGGADSNVITQDYTADNAAPSVSLRSPLDDATGVAIDSTFVIDFDETMERTGTYTLRFVGGAAVEIFDLAAGTGDGGGTAVWSTNASTDDRLTLTPGSNLTESTDYAWRRAGLQDLARNPLPDVTDDTTYNFTTVAAAGGTPAIVGTAVQTDSAGNVSQQVISMPSGIQAGEGLFVFVVNDGGATVSENTTSDWTLEVTDTQFNQGRGTFFYKVAGTGADALTIDLSASEHCKAIALRVENFTGFVESASAFNVADDPPSLSPTGGADDFLWLAAIVTDGFASIVTGAPANYTLNSAFASDGLGASVHGGLASRELNAATEDPGAFTVGGSEQHAVFTVAIK